MMNDANMNQVLGSISLRFSEPIAVPGFVRCFSGLPTGGPGFDMSLPLRVGIRHLLIYWGYTVQAIGKS